MSVQHFAEDRGTRADATACGRAYATLTNSTPDAAAVTCRSCRSWLASHRPSAVLPATEPVEEPVLYRHQPTALCGEADFHPCASCAQLAADDAADGVEVLPA